MSPATESPAAALRGSPATAVLPGAAILTVPGQAQARRWTKAVPVEGRKKPGGLGDLNGDFSLNDLVDSLRSSTSVCGFSKNYELYRWEGLRFRAGTRIGFLICTALFGAFFLNRSVLFLLAKSINHQQSYDILILWGMNLCFFQQASMVFP